MLFIPIFRKTYGKSVDRRELFSKDSGEILGLQEKLKEMEKSVVEDADTILTALDKQDSDSAKRIVINYNLKLQK